MVSADEAVVELLVEKIWFHLSLLPRVWSGIPVFLYFLPLVREFSQSRFIATNKMP